MKTVVMLVIMALSCSRAFADTISTSAPQESPRHRIEGGRDLWSRSSEKGAFVLDLMLEGKKLVMGPNSLDIVLRDRLGQGVEGAQLTVTPWMPAMGHGVWDKPLVQERGGGRYHVQNVTIIMEGVWELKVAVNKGQLADRGVFSFTVAEAKSAPQQSDDRPRSGYDRSLAQYEAPDVSLINQDGKYVKLKSLIDSGKPVILDFIFTTCTTVCPVLSAGFTNLRRELGAKAEQVQLISITIDPEHDRPEQLARYRQRFSGGPGWEFLTGSRDDVGRVLRAFDAFVVDKMSHEPLYLLRASNSTQWVRIKGLIKKSDLVAEYRKMEAR
jgi:protein SCO1